MPTYYGFSHGFKVVRNGLCPSTLCHACGKKPTWSRQPRLTRHKASGWQTYQSDPRPLLRFGARLKSTWGPVPFWGILFLVGFKGKPTGHPPFFRLRPKKNTQLQQRSVPLFLKSTCGLRLAFPFTEMNPQRKYQQTSIYMVLTIVSVSSAKWFSQPYPQWETHTHTPNAL